MKVPALRFPEFKTPWEKIKIGSFVEERSVISDEAIPLYSLTIDDGVTPKTDRYEREHLVGDISNAYKLVLPGDFAFNPMNLRFGAIARHRSDEPVRISKYYNVFACSNQVCAEFLDFYFKSPSMMRGYDIISTGSLEEKKRVHFSNFVKFEAALPARQEQEKIASFLLAIDEMAAFLSKKLGLLGKYKSDVSHLIFGRKIRFRIDRDNSFPEWGIEKLGHIAIKVKLKNKNGDIKTVLTNSATKGIVDQSDYFDRDIVNKNNMDGYYVVEVDDFVYNPRISSNAPVGPVKRNKVSKGVMSPLYTIFRFKSGCLAFFEQYFESSYWHDHIRSVANSGARHDRMNVSSEGFFSLPIPLPINEEQIKIAKFLSEIDRNIANVDAQLGAIRRYKQGLLQRMFV